MPIFSTRKIATQVTLSDGETAIIDGLTRDEIKKVNEKNQVSTENNQTRSLLIFVSANIASAEGSPVRKNLNKKLEELKAEKNQLAEQLNKVNKRLAEIRAGID
jgi:type II secretory pathway component GspD/PulD (secretin)